MWQETLKVKIGYTKLKLENIKKPMQGKNIRLFELFVQCFMTGVQSTHASPSRLGNTFIPSNEKNSQESKGTLSKYVSGSSVKKPDRIEFPVLKKNHLYYL